VPARLVVALVIRVFHALRQLWCGFRHDLCESRIALTLLYVMRVMTFGTDEPALLAGRGPFTDTFAVQTFAPVPVHLAVTLAA